MEHYRNKRILLRRGGKFRKAGMQDVGVGGTCENCGHLLLRHYDGDPRDTCPDPRKIRFRCFACEPETDAEKALAADIEASKPKQVGIIQFLESAAPDFNLRQDGA